MCSSENFRLLPVFVAAGYCAFDTHMQQQPPARQGQLPLGAGGRRGESLSRASAGPAAGRLVPELKSCLIRRREGCPRSVWKGAFVACLPHRFYCLCFRAGGKLCWTHPAGTGAPGSPRAPFPRCIWPLENSIYPTPGTQKPHIPLGTSAGRCPKGTPPVNPTLP